MKRIYIKGLGAVSPAGWNVKSLREAVSKGEPLACTMVSRPGSDRTFRARRVTPEKPAAAFLNHARLRRTSAVSSYTVSAAWEALGSDLAAIQAGSLRLGVVACVLTGSIQFTRRFYEETWRAPSSASPLVFPETVFNAPASHLAAMLPSATINYTLVGDPGTYLQGLALGAQWIAEGKADACVVVGAEEFDWLTAEALHRFSRESVSSEGAGAVYLTKETTGVELVAVTDSYLFADKKSKAEAVGKMRAALKNEAREALSCDSGPEVKSLAGILGEGLMAGAAWQCVVAADRLQQGQEEPALVTLDGSHQQAIGACFARTK